MDSRKTSIIEIKQNLSETTKSNAFNKCNRDIKISTLDCKNIVTFILGYTQCVLIVMSFVSS